MVMTRPPLPRRRDRADGFSVWARPCTSPAPSSTPGPPRSCIAYLKRRARRDRGTEPLVAAAAYTAPASPSTAEFSHLAARVRALLALRPQLARHL
jgi:hypothetical protein